MTTEKLTLQALKQHDKIHPNFKASTGSMSTGKDLPKQASRGELDVPQGQAKRRTRMASTSESVSNKSAAQPTKPKMSIFRLVAATRAWHRLATKKSRGPPKPVQKLENTYKMEPDMNHRFIPRKVEKLLSDVLEARLQDVSYHATICGELAKDISAHIKARVKAMDFWRYKIISSVIIMERKGSSAHVASRCVWDASSDSYATFTYTNSSLVATAHVFGVYFE